LFRSYAEDLFASTTPSGRPPFMVYRVFQTDQAESCPSLGAGEGPAMCEDIWVATIAPR
jgi:hypothetical protein